MGKQTKNPPLWLWRFGCVGPCVGVCLSCRLAPVCSCMHVCVCACVYLSVVWAGLSVYVHPCVCVCVCSYLSVLWASLGDGGGLLPQGNLCVAFERRSSRLFILGWWLACHGHFSF